MNNVFDFLSWLYKNIGNGNIDLQKLAYLIKPPVISGDFKQVLIREEVDLMANDILVYKVTPNVKSEATDIVSYRLSVSVDGVARDAVNSVDAFELKVVQDAQVEIKVDAVDDAGNVSNVIEHSFKAIDTLAPVLTGDVNVELVKEEAAPAPEPAPPVDEQPAPPVEETPTEEAPAEETPSEEGEGEASEENNEENNG